MAKKTKASGKKASSEPLPLSLTKTFKVRITCKNTAQKKFLKAMEDASNDIVFGMGSAGTGKSFLSLGYALKAVRDGLYEKMVILIPTCPAGGRELNMGFLKGTLDEKAEPFKEVDLQTIEKILKLSGNDDVKKISKELIEEGKIEYRFVNFILGMTFDNSVILVNECEQYTPANMKLILTRLGEHSKIICTGDEEQVNRNDIVNKKEECGLTYVSERLKDLEEVEICRFERKDIVRNPLITKILDRL